MHMIKVSGLLLSACIGLGAGIGCTAPGDEATTGTLGVNLTGAAPSGAVYRLRDATVTVNGPTTATFHTEDDPTRTSLSADVSPGDYTAAVSSGWRVERVDAGSATPVVATLVSDNPVAFTVMPQQRTNVPLRFRIDREDVDLTQGYDITIDIDESIPSPGDGYQAIDAPSPRRRVVFDAARQALYGVNTLDQEIERFAFSDGGWSALAPVVIPEITDIAITPDGQTLIVLDSDHVSDIALATGTFAPILRATNPDPFCGASFETAAAGNNNKVFIVTDLRQCSGFSTAYIYDTQSHALASSTLLFFGTAAASGDGSRIYIGGGFDDVLIYNPQSNTFSDSTVDASLFPFSVSGDASRVIVHNTGVYSRSLTLLGNLPPGGVAQVSRDASKAYIYRDDAPGPRLSVYDLNGQLQAGALFPLIRTIRLPHSANATNGGFTPVAMTTNADDSLVFISGNRRVVVVPVN